MTHKLTKFTVLPLKHPCKNRLVALSIKGAVIVAVGIAFVAALVGIFA
jgi:hypothetical protein